MTVSDDKHRSLRGDQLEREAREGKRKLEIAQEVAGPENSARTDGGGSDPFDDVDSSHFTLVWSTKSGAAQKISFEPRSDSGYLRVESKWTGSGWVKTGSGLVETVEVAGSLPASPANRGP